MDVTAKSLILDLLVTLKHGAMPVRSLVAASTLFGIEENNVRVALARLMAGGQVERDERGQYRLGARADAVRAQVGSWRALEKRTVPWDGSWVAVLGAATKSEAGLPSRGRQRLGLRFLGFQPLQRGVAVRPNNIRGGVEQMRSDLRALGLSRNATVCTLRELDSGSDARARRLWDVAALEAGYRASLRELARSEMRLPRLPAHEAMVESFMVGGRIIRQLVLDPLLPEAIAPVAARQALGGAMQRYDRAGRACWAGFLREFGVLHRHTPLDTRLAASVNEAVGIATGGT